ncbi:serine/threonine protein phosphatase [Bacillaceae bacterium SIJ1]|uniref:LamG-like jellyroll fold domain-containing protein n=1 Tax=Litoribacterium kuwaitense TaxID=1398745 RepID=UPI0013EBA761|nr:LamG-like jellyroll fold domain-containing protein [Litoribacterium kuwaitense]NGP45520.1 serine/threonine protein phosphatase [Litoribacterium kuwaitense]
MNLTQLRHLIIVVMTFTAIFSFSQLDKVSAQEEKNEQFKVAILPDTQKITRYQNDIFMAQTLWIANHWKKENIVFTAHLGDIVDRANQAYEWENADASMSILDHAKHPYGYLAGNHDVLDPSQKDVERDLSNEPYLSYFSTERMENIEGFGGHTANGFNSYYTFEGGGQEFIALFLDWRASEETLKWADKVLEKHDDLPAILFTHQLMNISSDQQSAVMTEHGQFLWDELIASNDQIFMTVNGHHHGYAHKVQKNDFGNDVVLMVVDYQSGYQGGNGLMRTLSFDLLKNQIHVESFSPWVMQKPEHERTSFDEERLVDDLNDFLIKMDFEERFARFISNDQEAADENPAIEGTVAHWRFQNDDVADGESVASNGDIAVEDVSGNGAHLYRQDEGQAVEGDLVWDHLRDRSSIRFTGDKTKDRASYLKTANDAKVNDETFEDGYTVEAVVKIDQSFDSSKHAWMGILTRGGIGEDVKKTEGDANAPLATMSVSSLKEIQWAALPLNKDDVHTSWSWAMDDQWVHIAVVNDGKTQKMYLDGAEVLRNDASGAQGIETTGGPWRVGASQYGNELDAVFNGWIDEIRITDRPLAQNEFLNK